MNVNLPYLDLNMFFSFSFSHTPGSNITFPFNKGLSGN